ncbi:MAG: hypothetical protein ACLFPP_04710 [Spirochaetaceae bacterium]
MRGTERATRTVGRGAATAAGILILVLSLAGCGSRAELDLDPDGSGTAEVVVDLDRVFIAYFRDLSGSVGGDEETPIFDLDAITERLGEEEHLTLRGARSPAQGRLELQISFDSIADLAGDARFGRLIEYTENGGTLLRIRVTPEDVPFLLSLSGMAEGSPVEMLLPPSGGEMNSQEYREYLVWALEEYETPGRLRQILDGAAVTVTVTTPDTIDQVVNGEELSPREARFRIEVLSLLTGEEDGVYELRY